MRLLLLIFSIVTISLPLLAQDLVPKALPDATVSPTPRFIPGDKEMTASFSDAAGGEPKLTFPSRTEKLYAQWRGLHLPAEAKIRCVWIAENVGDIAEPNYTIDEAKTTASKPDAYGSFALSRPEDGWAPGDYRGEFYVNDKLAATVRIKITE